MKTTIFFTTNAGVYFSSGRSEILIDGIHDAAAVGFMPMAEAMDQQLESKTGIFAGSGTLLFTHLHKDHYHAGKVRQYLERHPETGLWGPGLKNHGSTYRASECPEENKTVGEHMSSPGIIQIDCGELKVTAYKTLHSGENFRYIPHYSFLVRNDDAGEAFFIAGDAALNRSLVPLIRKDCAGRSLSMIAFVTAYQLIEPESREFFEELEPACFVLIHQPPEDSEAGKTLTGILKYVRRYPPADIRIVEPEPMHQIRIGL